MPESGGKKAGYEIALDRAWAELEIDAVSPAAGAKPCPTGGVSLEYFGREHRVDPANRSIRGEDGDKPPDTRKILILHYLLGARGAPPGGHDIGFAQIPGAAGYLRPFSGRVILPLVGMLDREPEQTAAAFAAMGGERLDFATWCCTVRAFALIPLKIIYWQGNEEMASGGQIVFDAGIGKILAVEDVAVLCEDMVRLLRE